MSGGFGQGFSGGFRGGGPTSKDFNFDFSDSFAGGKRPSDFNYDFSDAFAGGLRPGDFSYDFSDDFARARSFRTFPSTVYIMVPPSFPIQVPQDHWTVYVQPEPEEYSILRVQPEDAS